jgi:hypothetical protein
VFCGRRGKRRRDLLRPKLTAWNDRVRLHWHERRARLRRLDWKTTVIGRPLSAGEAVVLAKVDVRRLDCAWVVKNPAIDLGAADALDAAILDRTRLLGQRQCGPARVARLPAALDAGGWRPRAAGLVVIGRCRPPEVHRGRSIALLRRSRLASAARSARAEVVAAGVARHHRGPRSRPASIWRLSSFSSCGTSPAAAGARFWNFAG